MTQYGVTAERQVADPSSWVGSHRRAATTGGDGGNGAWSNAESWLAPFPSRRVGGAGGEGDRGLSLRRWATSPRGAATAVDAGRELQQSLTGRSHARAPAACATRSIVAASRRSPVSFQFVTDGTGC